MPGLRLLLLGSPRVEQEDTSLKINRRKAVALLVYLAVSGEAHQRETLATMLWPANDQASAHAHLRRDLSELNKTLGKGWLDISREAVALQRRADFWLDVADYRRLLAACAAHSHPLDEVCPACMPLLEQAVSLYRGDFMAGFTLPDSPDFDEWQYFEREELRCDLAGVLHKLAHGHSARGEFEAGLRHARRWLGLEPWHEPAHRQLMQLYAWSGNQAAALHQYQECVRVLQAELGQPPEEATRELYEAIRARHVPAPPLWEAEEAGRPQGDGLADFALPPPRRGELPAAAPARHNLPQQATPFVGRDQELADMGRLLLDEPDCQMLTLLGPGGIGKTRLALEAAARSLDAFPHGVYLVPLASVGAPEFLAPAIADALSLSFYGSANPQAQLLNYLREKEMLLVLDNFEHLLEGAGLLSDILGAAPGIKLLVTSRERLNLQREWVREVRGLPYPDPHPYPPPDKGRAGEEVLPPPDYPHPYPPPDKGRVGGSAGEEVLPPPIGGRVGEGVEDYSAVRLFVQSARRARPDFALTPANQPGVARICQLVEGMPLGLELAAAWVRVMPVEDIAREIRHNLDFLTTSMRDVPARHRSLRALFDHSWRLLGEAERRAIRQLSVLRGSFRREAAALVAGAGLPALAALVDKSMLRAGPGGRYDMHELVRQYAAEKLRAAPEESQAAGERHCRYFLAFLQERERHLRGARLGEAGAEIAADIDNIRAAWRWAIAHARLAEIGGCMEALHLFYFGRSWFQEGHEAFREAGVGLASAGRPGAPRDRGRDLLLARLLARQARFSHRLGLYREARELLGASLEVLRRLEDAGHPGVQRDKAFCLYNLAELLRGDGEYQQSRQLFEESMAIFRASGDRLGLARAMRRLGMIAGSLGEYAEAQRLFQQALERFKAIGDPYGIANTMGDLGVVADMLGNPAETKRLYQECLAIRREIGHLWGIGISLNNLGYFAYLHGEYAEAKPLLHESLKIQQEIGDQYQIANCLFNLGAVGCALGDYAEARGYFYEALRFAMEIWALPLVMEVLTGAAGLLDASQAGAQERAAEQPPRPAGVPPGETGASQGGLRAAELCAFVLAHPATDKPTRDIAAARLAGLEGELPPAALAAARARGQAAQLEVVVAELLSELGQAGAE